MKEAEPDGVGGLILFQEASVYGTLKPLVS